MAKKKTTKSKAVPVCIPKSLPEAQQEEAAKLAMSINPMNAPPIEAVTVAFSVALVGETPSPLPQMLALMTGKWWGPSGVDLTVGFMDNPSSAFRRIFLEHANSWGEWANVKFRETATDPQVRLARTEGGYWSYLGTDILGIPKNEATMNLEGFTDRTSDSMWRRVGRHEVGHTIGCPHEQLRLAIVRRIDPRRAITYFRQTSGWDEQTTRFNVLTPLEDRSLMASAETDETSIMCYSLPSSIMRDGREVQGGSDLSSTDKAFIATVYPKKETPPPPPVGVGEILTLVGLNSVGQEVKRFKVAA